jgi:hypothetical protein
MFIHLLLAEETQVATKSFWDVVHGVPVHDLAPLVVFSLTCAVVAVIVVATIASKTTCRIHKAQLEDALKRELVDRGFAADEIAKIVETSPLNSPSRGRRCGIKLKGA